MSTVKLRDPRSSITHLIGGGLAIVALVLLILKQVLGPSINYALFVSTILFGASMILLYFTSGIYHAISAKKEKLVLYMRKLDHSMIYVLIAGSYSPFCLYVLPKKTGIPVFVTALYIGMGWVAIFVIKDLYINLVGPAFFLLVLGGLLYTIGGVIYAIKRPNIKNWNFHDIFHIFIMLGSLAHFLLVFLFLI